MVHTLKSLLREETQANLFLSDIVEVSNMTLQNMDLDTDIDKIEKIFYNATLGVTEMASCLYTLLKCMIFSL